jgi:hypothetical protein
MHSYFSPEALEALQEAYANQLTTPDEMDIDQLTGMPTNQVSNTSPWHGTVDLWKYPDGKNKLETSPIMYRGGGEDEAVKDDGIYDESDHEVGDDDGDEDEETLSEEEVDALIQELLESDEDE